MRPPQRGCPRVCLNFVGLAAAHRGNAYVIDDVCGRGNGLMRVSMATRFLLLPRFCMRMLRVGVMFSQDLQAPCSLASQVGVFRGQALSVVRCAAVRASWQHLRPSHNHAWKSIIQRVTCATAPPACVRLCHGLASLNTCGEAVNGLSAFVNDDLTVREEAMYERTRAA